jgi:hypothetical protein
MLPARSILWLVGTLTAALFIEAGIYRQGWYYKYLEPESAAASVELPLYWLKRFRPFHRQEILVVGDSRMAEGFSADQANLESGRRNLAFWNIGIPGSAPRIWYYFLRDADPSRHRFQAIVFALDYYNDEDQHDIQAAHVGDATFLVGRLRADDVMDFAASMASSKPTSREDQRAAFVAAMFKGTLLQSDARGFLQDIRGRIARSKDARERGLGFFNGYPGNAGDLHGLSANWQTRTLTFPPGIPPERQNSIREVLMPDLPPHTGETTRYRKLWFGRILELYRGSPTKIVFLEHPRGPLPQPERRSPQAFLDWARKQPNVIVLDQFAFRDLESPETYFDGFHLNRKGRETFTARLTHLLLGAL